MESLKFRAHLEAAELTWNSADNNDVGGFTVPLARRTRLRGMQAEDIPGGAGLHAALLLDVLLKHARFPINFCKCKKQLGLA